jgi:hypothetical protein
MGEHSQVPGVLAHVLAGKRKQASQSPCLAGLSQGDSLGQSITAGMSDKGLFGIRTEFAVGFRPELGFEPPEMGEQHGIHCGIAIFKVSSQPFGGVIDIDQVGDALEGALGVRFAEESDDVLARNQLAHPPQQSTHFLTGADAHRVMPDLEHVQQLAPGEIQLVQFHSASSRK